jgi:hypothetical protein
MKNDQLYLIHHGIDDWWLFFVMKHKKKMADNSAGTSPL